MTMTRRNLFYVNIDEVERALAEANAPLARRCAELLGAAERMPARLDSREDIAKAVRFSKMIAVHINDCRAARLSDEQSFKDAVKPLRNFSARSKSR